jgi:hypothetical protein
MHPASSISLSELARLNDADYRTRVRALVAVPSSQKVAELEAQIRQFEKARGLNSEEMRTRLASGQLEETLDVCDWLMALKLRDRLVGPRSR